MLLADRSNICEDLKSLMKERDKIEGYQPPVGVPDPEVAVPVQDVEVPMQMGHGGKRTKRLTTVMRLPERDMIQEVSKSRAGVGPI